MIAYYLIEVCRFGSKEWVDYSKNRYNTLKLAKEAIRESKARRKKDNLLETLTYRIIYLEKRVIEIDGGKIPQYEENPRAYPYIY